MSVSEEGLLGVQVSKLIVRCLCTFAAYCCALLWLCPAAYESETHNIAIVSLYVISLTLQLYRMVLFEIAISSHVDVSKLISECSDPEYISEVTKIMF